METGGFGREIALGDAGREVKGFNTEDTENYETRGHRDAVAGRGLWLSVDSSQKQIPRSARDDNRSSLLRSASSCCGARSAVSWPTVH